MFARLIHPPRRGDGLPPGGPAGPGSSDVGFFGFLVLLASLSMIFAAMLAGFVYLRVNSDKWHEFGRMPLPPGLLLSTLNLIAGSFTVHRALTAVRRDRPAALRRWISVTLALGVLFLILQSWNWWWAHTYVFPTSRHIFPLLFYTLSGLHAAHVLGGAIPLAVVTYNAFRGRYTPIHHPGVRYCALYWHFLDATWLLIVLALLLR